MKRRDFLLFSMLSIVTERVFAASVWLKAGVMGYSPKAPASAVKFKKRCGTCTFYFRDLKFKDGEQCSNPIILEAAKVEQVYVKEKGYCTLWKKDG